MGRPAQYVWIIRVFAALFGVLTPAFAYATATAQGVALNASAGCSNGNLDITLTTLGANSEGWSATDLAGTSYSFNAGQPTLQWLNFSGTFTGFQLVFFPSQPAAGTQIASYAYVGETPPAAANTAEFFVFYQCTTRQVLLSCFGPYGSCPQNAQQAQALLAPKIPAQNPMALALVALLIAGIGGRAIFRRA